MSPKKNYTKPYDKNYEDTPDDYFFLAMTFSQTLGAMLENGHGVFIELKGEALKIHPNAKQVIVFNDDDLIRVVEASERSDLKHGDRVLMIKQDNIIN